LATEPDRGQGEEPALLDELARRVADAEAADAEARAAADAEARERADAEDAEEQAAEAEPAPPFPPRTKWTRRTHPVLIGHAASLTPY
jgi:septal ring factor EnvC (AmiA/AmiB activator)